MHLSDLVIPAAVQPRLACARRDEAIAELIDLLILAGAAQPQRRAELLASALEREKRGSTGFGKGVAVPHIKLPDVERVSLAVGLSPEGIDFNSLDRQPVHSVFLLLSPTQKPEEHLKAMEVIFQRLSDESFRRALRHADTSEKALDLLRGADPRRAIG